MPRVRDVWVATNAPRGDHLPFGIDIDLSLGADAPTAADADKPSAEALPAEHAATVTMSSSVGSAESAVFLGQPDTPVSGRPLAKHEVPAGRRSSAEE